MGCRALFLRRQTSPDCAAGDCTAVCCTAGDCCTAVPIVCQNKVSLFASVAATTVTWSLAAAHCGITGCIQGVTGSRRGSLLYYLHLHAQPTLLCSPLPAPPVGRDFLEAIMMIFSIFSARFHRTRAVNLKWLPSPAIFPTASAVWGGCCSTSAATPSSAWCCRSVSGHSSL